MEMVRLWRFGKRMRQRNHKVISNLVKRWLRIRFSSDISFKAEIGKNVYFGHDGLGVIVTHKAKIGNNVSIMPMTVIGLMKSELPGPVIGDNCIIGSGAKVLGPIKLGNNVRIGANTVIIKDIPDNATAVGVPARIIHHEEKE